MQLRVARFRLAEISMRAGLGLVWGGRGLGKGVISRLLVGGFDFGWVWIGRELICARCAAGFAVV